MPALGGEPLRVAFFIPYHGQWCLVATGIDGSQPVQLTGPGGVLRLDGFGDGLLRYPVRVSSEPPVVSFGGRFLADLRDGGLVNLDERMPEGWHVGDSAISRTAGWVAAIACQGQGQGRLLVGRLPGLEFEVAYEASEPISQPDVSATGHTVVCVAGPVARGESDRVVRLFRRSAEGWTRWEGAPRGRCPRLSADGKRLFWLSADAKPNLYGLDVGAGRGPWIAGAEGVTAYDVDAAGCGCALLASGRVFWTSFGTPLVSPVFPVRPSDSGGYPRAQDIAISPDGATLGVGGELLRLASRAIAAPPQVTRIELGRYVSPRFDTLLADLHALAERLAAQGRGQPLSGASPAGSSSEVGEGWRLCHSAALGLSLRVPLDWGVPSDKGAALALGQEMGQEIIRIERLADEGRALSAVARMWLTNMGVEGEVEESPALLSGFAAVEASGNLTIEGRTARASVLCCRAFGALYIVSCVIEGDCSDQLRSTVQQVIESLVIQGQ